MYVLHRHAALLPIRVSDINSKVLKDSARGAGRVVLKDVARRLRAIFGLRLVEADKVTAVSSSTTSSSSSASAAFQRAGGEASTGRKRGRPGSANTRAAANAGASAADAYIVTAEPPSGARASGRQQVKLASDGADATTPKRLLSSWRAHSALLFATLALCAFTYKDGVIAEERLLSLLAGLFGLGSARELRQTRSHLLFGDVCELLSHTWVEQQYVERRTLQSEEVGGDFTMYGGSSEDNKEPHHRLGVRGRLEVGYERLYRFMVEDVMDGEVSEAGVREMQKRDVAAGAQSERRADDEQRQEQQQQRVLDDGFAFTQPTAGRRSAERIVLPQEQSRTQRLPPYQQAVLRYLLAHSVSAEPAVLAFYRQTSPPSPRSPSLDELYTAVNDAIEWAALRVERVTSEYADERVWLVVSRSDADSAAVFSAFSSDEVAVCRAWLQTLVADENENGAAAMTVAEMEAVAARVDGLGRERAKRLADCSRELAERLTAHGWLHQQRKVEPQLYSVGMRSCIELLKPRALAAASGSISSSLSSSSPSSASSSAPSSLASSFAGGLTLRLHECGRCRFDVFYGVYCGTQQDEQPDCRHKYHAHCVQRVRQAGQQMKCRAGHTWKPRARQRADMQDGAAYEQEREEREAGDGSNKGSGSGGSSNSNKVTRHRQRVSQPPREQRGGEDEKRAESAERQQHVVVDEEDSAIRLSPRRRLRRG